MGRSSARASLRDFFTSFCGSSFTCASSCVQIMELNTRVSHPHQEPVSTQYYGVLSSTSTFYKQKNYSSNSREISELKKFPDRTLGVRLCTAKEDWLLFAQNDYHCKPFRAFFFNPFTKTIIWLPDLLGNPMSMWFASPPTSTEWKVVVLRNYFPNIAIDTIKCKEDRWTSCEFEIRENLTFQFLYCNPVLYKGMYYVFGNDSTLLIHNPKKKTFFFHEAPEFLHWLGGEQYILESSGKLFAVFVRTGGRCLLVCRWNLSKRQWEKLESLGNKAFFVSRPYSMSETVSAEMGNRIYFPRLMGDRCLFYSLDTKRFHTSDGSLFTSFHGSKVAFSSTWIKPTYMGR